MTPSCIECGLSVQVHLVTGREVYPHRPDLYSKHFWKCECGAYVGCHPGTNKPLGTCAGAYIRRLRSKVHAKFDPIWKNRGVPRQEAYARMAHALGMTIDQCHIGMFTISDCHKALTWLNSFTIPSPHDINMKKVLHEIMLTTGINDQKSILDE